MKKFSKLLLGLVSCLSLASCGKPTDSGTTSAGGTQGKINVYFWTTTGAQLEEQIESYATQFEKYIKQYEGVDVDIIIQNQGGYDEIKSQITTGLGSNIIPTIAVAYPDHVASYLADKPGSVVNLADYINSDTLGFKKDPITELNDTYDETDFIQKYYEEGTIYQEEGVYSLPFLKSSEVMIVNSDLVEKRTFGSEVNNGREVTSTYLSNMTWDDLMALCKYVVENKDEFPNVKWPLYIDSDSNFFITQAMQRGLPYLGNGDTAEEKLLFNNKDTKAMVQEFYDLFDQGYFMTKGNNNSEYGSNYFTKEETLITIGSSGGAGYNDLVNSVNGVGVYKVPAANDNPVYVSQGLTLCMFHNPANADDNLRIEYGWRFLKYILSPNANTILSFASQGYVPVRTSAVTSPSYQAYINPEYEDDETLLTKTSRVVINDINGAYYNLPLFKGSDAARTQVEGIVSSFVRIQSGGLTLDDAFQNAYEAAVSSL